MTNPRTHLYVFAVALAAIGLTLGSAANAADSLKNDAKETGHAVGSAIHTVGKETKKTTKKVGKEVKHAATVTGHAVRDGARETGHAFRDGAKELKSAAKGEDEKK